MQAFEISQIIHEQQAAGRLYLEFIKLPSLSVGVYSLLAGGADPQQPHNEDEVYYVISGSASIRVASEDRPVRAGSVVLVEKGVEHRFHSIAEDLTILVFFAPAEYSLADNSG